MIMIPAFALSLVMQRSTSITIPENGIGTLTDSLTHPRSVRIAHDGSALAIVFDKADYTGVHLYYSYSSDLGRTLSQPLEIASGKTVDTMPRQYSVAVGGGSVWVSYRRGDRLYAMESNRGSRFTPEVQIATGVGSVMSADDRFDARNQWIGYSDGGLVVAYPVLATKNVMVGRIDVGALVKWTRPTPVAPTGLPQKGSTSKGGMIIKPQKNTIFKKVPFVPKPFRLSTIALLKDAYSVGTVRVYGSGPSVRVMIDKNLDPKWLVGMSQSNDGGRHWETLANTAEERDNHVTYLGYQESGSDIRFKGIGTTTLPGEYELTVGRTGREWLAIKGDNPTWGVSAWQIVTADDPNKGLFHGIGVVPTQWYSSVNIRPRPEPRTGETDFDPLPQGKPSIADSRGIPEVFWCQGYLLSRGTGTAWQTSFEDADLHSRYVGVQPTPWRTYVTPSWSNADAYRRTSNVRTAFLTEMHSYIYGPEVVHIGVQKHPTRRGAFQTVFKPMITSDWSPLVPGEDSGAIDWLDYAGNGSSGFFTWISNGHLYARTVVDHH